MPLLGINQQLKNAPKKIEQEQMHWDWFLIRHQVRRRDVNSEEGM